ncbi:MAG: SRPBCC domain-containing protein, partial [Gemmatimonadota bacterium]
FIEARPETVFAILSDPARFSEWLGGEASFEPRPGSPLVVRFPAFGTVIEGEVLEIRAPEHIAFSWGVSEGEQAAWLPPGSTRVEVRLVAEAGGTRVTLIHSGLPSDQEVDRLTAGWRFHTSRLALFANRAQLAGTEDRIVGAWLAAWNEVDAEARARRLAECCLEDVAFKDEYAALDGRELLATHIANTRRFMPGLRLEADGRVRICRGEMLIPWRAVSAEGEVRLRGVNHAVVTPEGRFRRVTSFWSAHERPPGG